MSNLIINIRILMWHFQVSDNWKVKIEYNEYHRKLEHGWFRCYEFKPFKKNSHDNIR